MNMVEMLITWHYTTGSLWLRS